MKDTAEGRSTKLATIDIQALQSSRQVTLQGLVTAFLAAQDVAESSRVTYERHGKQFINWLNVTGRDQNLGALRREDILAYKKWLTDSGKSASTISSYILVTKLLFKWLDDEGIFKDIARTVKTGSRPKGFRKDIPTVEQLREVLDAIDVSDVIGLRDYALVNLLARTGIRTIEAARATVDDIRQESGTAVLWVHGKGCVGKDSFVVLTHAAEKPLRRYLSERGSLIGNDALFASESDRNPGQALTTRSISRIVKTRFRNVGLDSSRLTAHSLRHFAITEALRGTRELGGATIQQVQGMARHAQVSVTLSYAHNISRVEDAAEKHIEF